MINNRMLTQSTRQFSLMIILGDFQVSNDAGRLQDENWRDTFQGQWDTKLENKFDNVEDGWNNFKKIVCEFADGVLGKIFRNAARNIIENSYI